MPALVTRSLLFSFSLFVHFFFFSSFQGIIGRFSPATQFAVHQQLVFKTILLFSCMPFSFCLSKSPPFLAPTHAVPLHFLLRESIFCQTQVPANKMWMPEINERPQRSHFLHASSRSCSTVSALSGSRPPSLGLFPLPPGIYSCAWSKSLQAGVCCHASALCDICTWLHLCAYYALRCLKIPLGFHPHACLNTPAGGSFIAQLESLFSCFS